MECKCETCVRKDCADRTKQDDLRIVINCSDYLNMERQMTNADRLRAMTDEELAKFIAKKIVNLENHKMIEQGYTPTATQLSALGHTCYCTLVQWLKQPAEGGMNNA